jgi:type I restriction enzyme S subunit
MTSDWKETTLGAEVDLLTGFPFKSEGYTDAPDSVRLVRGDNIVQGAIRWDGVKSWPALECAEYEAYQLREGDVVLAMDRPWIEAGLKFAAISKHDLPCLLVQRTARLRGGPRLDTGFLRYLIASREFTQHIHAITTGTAVPHISGRQIKDFSFALPPIAEQREIAGVLGSLDEMIELNRRMNATLEVMARALFQSWFVDFDPVRAKLDGRSPAAVDPATATLFPKQLEDSPLGRIPKGWKACPLAELIEVVKGRSYRSEQLAEAKTALVTLKSFLRGGGYRIDGLKPFTGKYNPNQRVRPGDLVVAFTDVTQTADVIGKPALVQSDDRFENLVASLDVGIVRPKSKHVSIPFLYCLFLTAEFQAHAYSHATGTTVLHLGSMAIPSFVSVVPSVEIAENFAERAGPIFRLIDENVKQSRTIATLRDALLPKLLSGKLLTTITS